MSTIPWDDVLPLIRKWHAQGQPWTLMADSLNARYGTAVSPAVVQYRFDTMDDVPGYRIPARRPSQEKLTDRDVRTALHFANRNLGRRATAPLSIIEYDKVRDEHGRSEAGLPSSVSIRRKYGSWSAACEAVGVSTNAPRRSYDGLTADDAALWLAHWLRDLRREPGTPLASAAGYRKWVRDHPDAPSYDALRTLGIWGDLLEAAVDIEESHRRLAAPRGVSSGPRKRATELLDIP